MATGVAQAGPMVDQLTLLLTRSKEATSGVHVLMNSIVPVEIMTETVLILVVALVEAMRRLSKRLFRSRLTLETESFALTMQTKPHSSPQELQQPEQGGPDNGTSNNDARRISDVGQRPKW